jgi:hypothetical protein
MRLLGVALAVGISLDPLQLAWANNYDELKAAAVQRCAAIDAAAYQSGLLFNPDGYRSFYLRSQCFQQSAVEFRDDQLCADVKERRSLGSSSWGYSSSQCRKLVAEGIAEDRKVLEAKKRHYQNGALRLREFHIERNGNGRDYDIIPSFAGAEKDSFVLRFEITAGEGVSSAVLLHSSGYYLDAGSNLRIFVRQEEIRNRLVGFASGRSYSVRATMLLDVGVGGPSGRWSEAFIERAFPVQERAQAVTKDIRF